ncbi:hypothetical protein [Deinococcus apachensis]|uniref:hypothetical protein n=1 Tax=Deinococcus apachensis TaxID=309886 RepID=UPI0012F87CA5|nr:hypothetical protein [Deinococcus apachensis]
MLTILLSLLGGGVLIALGFLLHLAWFWVTGQDHRTARERAWEQREKRHPERRHRARPETRHQSPR